MYGEMGFPDCASGKEPACPYRRHKRQDMDLVLGWEDPLVVKSLPANIGDIRDKTWT